MNSGGSAEYNGWLFKYLVMGIFVDFKTVLARFFYRLFTILYRPLMFLWKNAFIFISKDNKIGHNYFVWKLKTMPKKHPFPRFRCCVSKTLVLETISEINKTLSWSLDKLVQCSLCSSFFLHNIIPIEGICRIFQSQTLLSTKGIESLPQTLNF